jgi:hypothetical protein
VLTAAHCLEESELDSFTTSTLDNYPASNRIAHPNYFEDDGFSSEDAGLVIVDTPIDYKAFQLFNIQEHKEGEAITVMGFGGTIDTLNAVSLTFSHYHWSYDFSMYSDVVSIDSHTTTGDSGSAWIINDEIIAVHKGSIFNSSTNERPTYGTDIRALQEFLTSNIDGWHYPTLADANGKTTITVQSLHQNDVTDSAYTEGDATLLASESTCMSKNVISPFEQCTYVIESNGGEGKLFLSDSESIHINKPQDNSGGGNNSSGDSGGSMGIWALMLLGFANLRRKH